MTYRWILLLLVLSLPLAACAEESEAAVAAEKIEPAKAFPDSPSYGLQKFFEKLQLAITANKEKKVQLLLKFAERRLSEAKKLSEENKSAIVEKLLAEYNINLEQATNEIDRSKKLGRNASLLADHISLATFKHTIVLQKVLERAPESARPAIEHALNVSQKGHDRAAAVKIEKLLEEAGKNISEQFLSEGIKEKLKKAGEAVKSELDKAEVKAEQKAAEKQEEKQENKIKPENADKRH